MAGHHSTPAELRALPHDRVARYSRLVRLQRGFGLACDPGRGVVLMMTIRNRLQPVVQVVLELAQRLDSNLRP